MKNYFRLSLLSCITFFQLIAYAQSSDLLNNKKNQAAGNFPLELLLVQKSEAPNTDEVHTYRLKITNTSLKEIQLKVLAENIKCDVDRKTNMPLQYKIFWTQEALESGENGAETIAVDANNSVEFYVRLIRPKDAVLDAWNCTSIKIASTD